ncbi:MAG: CDP-archaeol synthase [Acidobacteria bacterium]|nr:MAG: CDP-archaeol synthase [Acidobacteriota bacterium]
MSFAFHAIQLLYFMVPAYAANMTPPFAKYLRHWNRPISRRCLGSHKTVLGFTVGVLAAVGSTFVQSRIAWSGSMTSYDQWPVLGLLFGLGAMGGDSVKSFIKRRIGIPPGRPWIPFDQLDFVLGALTVVWHRVPLTRTDLVIVLLLSGIGDVMINHVSYFLGMRATKW